MKTNVSIELTDEQRSTLANIIDGKTNKRMATRKEVVDLCTQYIASLIGESAQEAPSKPQTRVVRPTNPSLNPSLQIDPEDRNRLEGKSAGYIRGWNMVKHLRARR